MRSRVQHAYVEVTSEQRELANKGDFQWHGPAVWLSCSREVWDGRNGQTNEEKKQIIVNTGRARGCYFWPYSPKQSLATAEDLQAKEASQRDQKKSHRVAIIGVTATIIGVVIAYLAYEKS